MQENPIKVLHVLSSGGIYGSEKVILPWMEHTPNTQPFLLVFPSPPTEDNAFAKLVERKGIKVKTVPSRKFEIPQTLKNVSDFVETIEPDIIHSHGYKGMFYACLVSRKYHIGHIHTNHGFVDTSLKKKFYNFVELTFARLLTPDKIIVVASNIQDRFLSFGIKKEKIEVITNGILPSIGKMVPTLTDDFLSSINNKIIASYVGRLSYEKGPDVLLDAIPHAIKKVKNLLFLIVGSGEMETILRHKLGNTKLNNHIIFLGFREDALGIIAKSDMVILPSRSEGIPMTLLEAMGLGIPVIATTVGDIPNIIEDGKEGLLIPPNNSNELVKAIIHLAINPKKRKIMGTLAKAKVLSDFNLETRLSNLSHIYRWVIHMRTL